jgi:hypothetical protein
MQLNTVARRVWRDTGGGIDPQKPLAISSEPLRSSKVTLSV